MKWTGSDLEIVGDIGGEVGQIDIGNPVVNGIRISDSGIFAYKNSAQTFSLTNTGDASFVGTINSASGTIGGATFSSATIGGQGALDVSRLKVSILMESQGISALSNSFLADTHPRVDNLHDLGFANPQEDRY